MNRPGPRRCRHERSKSARKALVAAAAFAATTQATAETTPVNSFGMPGLIDMPSAQVFPDGDLVPTVTVTEGQQRATLAFQIAPRITGAFRYGRLGAFYPDGDALYDRSFDISLLLLKESPRFPAVSVGLRDFAGTGIYAGEYIVATKTYGERLSVTAGLGWGRLGSDGGIGAPFGDRPPLDFGLGGTPSTSQWFRGDVAPFGGIRWQATERLGVTLEYSSDAYAEERDRGIYERKSPFNIGADYTTKSGITISGFVTGGTTVGVSVSAPFNPAQGQSASGSEPGGLPLLVRGADTPGGTLTAAQGDIVAGALAEVMEKEGVFLRDLDIEGSVATLAITNLDYSALPQAIGRSARLMTRVLPAGVDTFVIVPTGQGGQPLSRVVLSRAALEALEFAPAEALLAQTVIADAADEDRRDYKRLPVEWGVAPTFAVSYFDPDQPVAFDFGLGASVEAELGRGFVFDAAASATLVSTREGGEPGPSSLPRVRTDGGLYRETGKAGIDRLTFSHFGRPGADLYSRVSVGMIEPAFGGIVGEVLWKPVASDLALGVEVAQVWKRDYDRLLGFQDYDVLTGHASVYYAFADDYTAQLDVGRYLAGDLGATLTLKRQFDNGFEVGAFVTRTDATFEEFGEGSFDKGIVLTIPTEWLLGRPSRELRTTTLRSLSRDGGARLSPGRRLYPGVAEAHEGELSDRWGRFWR